MRILNLLLLAVALSSTQASSEETNDQAESGVPGAEEELNGETTWEQADEEEFAPPIPELDDHYGDELAITQVELRQRRQVLVGAHLGAVYPWQSYGLSSHWWHPDTEYQWGMTVGSGRFELSDIRDGRTLFLDASIQTALASYRRHIRNYPLYIESFTGLEFWNAELRPRGNEQTPDPEAASLISDFSGITGTLGVKAGLIWHWDNGLFVEYSILQASGSVILSDRYTNNTALARSMARRQIQSLRYWGGVNLKIGIRI